MNENEMKNTESLVSRFRKFMQQNRHDNQEHRTGWHERLVKIYLEHQKIVSTGTDRSRAWKKYPDKK